MCIYCMKLAKCSISGRKHRLAKKVKGEIVKVRRQLAIENGHCFLSDPEEDVDGNTSMATGKSSFLLCILKGQLTR